MSRLLKTFRLQGRREEETAAYRVVREDFRGPRIRIAPKEPVEISFLADREATPQTDVFSSLRRVDDASRG
jgi:hypothetical protein